MDAFLFEPMKVLMRKCLLIILKKLSIRQRDLHDSLGSFGFPTGIILVTSSITWLSPASSFPDRLPLQREAA